ncbi:unnamed protein product [Effrenium voratum]|nr:unnamed protein product [Effrenium voratum]
MSPTRRSWVRINLILMMMMIAETVLDLLPHLHPDLRLVTPMDQLAPLFDLHRDPHQVGILPQLAAGLNADEKRDIVSATRGSLEFEVIVKALQTMWESDWWLQDYAAETDWDSWTDPNYDQYYGYGDIPEAEEALHSSIEAVIGQSLTKISKGYPTKKELEEELRSLSWMVVTDSGKLHAHLTPGYLKPVIEKVFNLIESILNKDMISISRPAGSVFEKNIVCDALGETAKTAYYPWKMVTSFARFWRWTSFLLLYLLMIHHQLVTLPYQCLDLRFYLLLFPLLLHRRVHRSSPIGLGPSRSLSTTSPTGLSTVPDAPDAPEVPEAGHEPSSSSGLRRVPEDGDEDVNDYDPDPKKARTIDYDIKWVQMLESEAQQEVNSLDLYSALQEVEDCLSITFDVTLDSNKQRKSLEYNPTAFLVKKMNSSEVQLQTLSAMTATRMHYNLDLMEGGISSQSAPVAPIIRMIT